MSHLFWTNCQFYTQIQLALDLLWQTTTPRFRQINDLLLRITPCIAENIFPVSTTFEIRMIFDIKICFETFEQFKNARNTSCCITPGHYSVKQEIYVFLLQVNSLFVTTSSYPNRKTLTYRKENCLVNFALNQDNYLILILKKNREEFCIITKRLIKKCDSYKRKPLDREYPSLCTLLQPLKNIEWVLTIFYGKIWKSW